MNRIIVSILAAGAMLFASCQKNPIGDTATVSMAGEWYVTADVVDESGELLYEDITRGSFIIATFNTANNVAEELFVSDCGNFWEFQVQTVADPAKMTFATDGAAENLAYSPCNVTITGGKITYGTGKTPSGQPADEIEFCVTFDDDDSGMIYKLHGFRYTGLTADE